MDKLYDRIYFSDGNPPALSEETMNRMSKALNDLDDRLIYLAGGIAQALIAASPNVQPTIDALQSIAEHPPYVGTNGNWYIWNHSSAKYVNSKKKADILSKATYDADGDGIIDVIHGGTGNAEGLPQSGQKAGVACGVNAVSIGSNNEATGDYSACVGVQNKAVGDNAVAIGSNNYADKGAIAIGDYVFADDNSIVIGKGTADNSVNVRESRIALVGSSTKHGGFANPERDERPVFALNYDLVNAFNTPTASGEHGLAGKLEDSEEIDVSLKGGSLYLLLAQAYTVSTGAIYGLTFKMICTHGDTTGKPTNLTIAQTEKGAVATTLANNNHLIIKNTGSAQAANFTLIRIM